MSDASSIGLILTLQFMPCGLVRLRYSHRVHGITGNRDPEQEPEAQAALGLVTSCLRAAGAHHLSITHQHEADRRFHWEGQATLRIP